MEKRRPDLLNFGKQQDYLLNRRLGGSWNQSGVFGEDKNLVPLPAVCPATRCPFRRLSTVTNYAVQVPNTYVGTNIAIHCVALRLNIMLEGRGYENSRNPKLRTELVWFFFYFVRFFKCPQQRPCVVPARYIHMIKAGSIKGLGKLQRSRFFTLCTHTPVDLLFAICDPSALSFINNHLL